MAALTIRFIASRRPSSPACTAARMSSAARLSAAPICCSVNAAGAGWTGLVSLVVAADYGALGQDVAVGDEPQLYTGDVRAAVQAVGLGGQHVVDGGQEAFPAGAGQLVVHAEAFGTGETVGVAGPLQPCLRGGGIEGECSRAVHGFLHREAHRDAAGRAPPGATLGGWHAAGQVPEGSIRVVFGSGATSPRSEGRRRGSAGPVGPTSASRTSARRR